MAKITKIIETVSVDTKHRICFDVESILTVVEDVDNKAIVVLKRPDTDPAKVEMSYDDFVQRWRWVE